MPLLLVCRHCSPSLQQTQPEVSFPELRAEGRLKRSSDKELSTHSCSTCRAEALCCCRQPFQKKCAYDMVRPTLQILLCCPVGQQCAAGQ